MSFQRALEIALNAPGRQTRVRRINSGTLAIADAKGGRRVFRGAPAGTGDLVGYSAPDGLHVEVECKVGRDTVRPAQRRRRRAILAAGGVYVVVYDDPAATDLGVSSALEIIDQTIDGVRLRHGRLIVRSDREADQRSTAADEVYVAPRRRRRDAR